MTKAIGFTLFDRVDYLKETLKSWSFVRGIENFDIYFFVEPSDKIEQVIDIISYFEQITKAKVSIIKNSKKLGCAKNTWQVFDVLFDTYDFVILAEDDIKVSKDVLEYFDATESIFNEDDSVAVISANTKWHTDDPSLVVREKAFNGLVWGTWKKYWTSYIKDTWDFDYSSGNGEKSGWDWNLTLRVLPNNNLVSINPHVSRSEHIGVNGIHCSEDIFDLTKSPSFNDDNIWNRIKEV